MARNRTHARRGRTADAHRPTLELVPYAPPVQRSRDPWPSASPPPALPREAARLVGKLSQTHPDFDILCRWPATMLAMAEVIEATLRQFPDQSPEHVSRSVVIAITQYFSGNRGDGQARGRIDFPSPASIARVLRDAQIWREFDGRNTHELAAKYKMPVRTLCYVLRNQRRLRQRMRAERLGRV